MTIREVARRVGRDVKAVHGDVHALLNAGVLERTDDGRRVRPTHRLIFRCAGRTLRF